MNLSQQKTDDLPQSKTQLSFSGSVLLVDDNAINLKALYEQLKNLGLTVEQAISGAQALDLCRRHRFDLVLMDIQMPSMDGLEASRRIIKLLQEQAPPIIGVSAHVMDSDIENAKQAGLSDYLFKPISKIALLKLLDKYLNY